MKTDLPSPRVTLVRALGPVLGTAIVVGTVIGSGVFKKPQVVAENVPYFGLAALVWIMGGVLAFMGALALAEVAVLFPRAGGNYVFLREGYSRLEGFLFGWVEFCIIRSASLAALATIFAESLNDVLRNQAFQESIGLNLGGDPLGFWARTWLTVAVIMILALVNALGVRWGGLLQLFITLIKVGSLIGIALLPFIVAALAHPESTVPKPQPGNLLPLWPSWDAFEFGKLGTAMVAVLWAYHGWMNIAPVAEEVRNPQRNIPISLLAGVGIITTVYLGANLGYYLIIPQDQMAQIKNTTVATEFSLRLLGNIGGAVASAAVMCSVFGALNGNLLVGPRLLYAMGQDGLAPRALSKVHPKFHTPALAILILALWSILLVLAGALLTTYRMSALPIAGQIKPPEFKPLFDVMTDFAIFGAVIFETLAVTTVLTLRWKLPNAERPYRCWGYPFVPIIYTIILGLVALNMLRQQPTEAAVACGFIDVGAIVYFLWGRRSMPAKSGDQVMERFERVRISGVAVFFAGNGAYFLGLGSGLFLNLLVWGSFHITGAPLILGLAGASGAGLAALVAVWLRGTGGMVLGALVGLILGAPVGAFAAIGVFGSGGYIAGVFGALLGTCSGAIVAEFAKPAAPFKLNLS